MRIDGYGIIRYDETEVIPAGEHVLYGGEVRVRFDPGDHKYLVQDIRLGQCWSPRPSVTTILSILDKSKALVPWAVRCAQNKFHELIDAGRIYTQPELESFGFLIKDAHKEELDRAGRIGTQVHEWIQKYLEARAGRGAFPLPPIDPQVRSCCSAARLWIRQADVRPFAIERLLFTRKHGVISTTHLPAALIINQRTAICDWKSSNRLHDTYHLQLAAYRAMHAEMTGTFLDDRWLIRLDKEDSSFHPVCLPAGAADRDAKIFFALADTFKLLQSAGFA